MSQEKVSRRSYVKYVGGVVAVAVVGAAAYGVYEATKPPPAKKEIVVGCSLPLTGVAAGDGAKFQRGLQTAVDMVNEEGGILGAKLRTIVYDDGFDESKIAPLYETLITKDNVDFLLPPYGAPMSFPALAVCEKYGKFMISGYVGAFEIMDKFGGETYFAATMSGKDDTEFPYYTTWYYKALSDFVWNFDKWNYKSGFAKPTKIAVLNENQFWGIETHKLWRPIAEQQGWDIVVDELVGMAQMDFADVITKIKLAKPDLILCEFFFFRCIPFIKQMHELGVTAPFVAMSESGMSLDWTDPAKGVGDLGNGIITFAYIPSTYHGGRVDYLRTKIPEACGLLEAGHFAAIEMIKQAVTKAGSVDTDAVKKALLTEKFETCITPVKFDDKGANTLWKPIVGQWINNKVENVWPRDITAKPIYPYSPPM